MNWVEWLQSGGFGIDRVENTGILLIAALTGSLISSLLISMIYVKFYGGRGTGSQIHRAFPLIGPSITAIFVAIQFSLPLSLGLLGALSIVRFRMPIKEAEEIGFILLVVAVSLSWATVNVQLAGLLLLFSIPALLVASSWKLLRRRPSDGLLIVTMPTGEYLDKKEAVVQTLEKALPKGSVDSISEDHDEAVISYRFPELDTARLLALRRELVETTSQVSVFFSRSGGA